MALPGTICNSLELNISKDGPFMTVDQQFSFTVHHLAQTYISYFYLLIFVVSFIINFKI